MDFLKFSDVVPATLKTSIFGLCIGIVSCWTGISADRSSDAVGHAATSGVVRSILSVFALNVGIVPLIQAILDATGWID
jgi:phospholipid/cholesterol/gamma-HCH transport system permease protein